MNIKLDRKFYLHNDVVTIARNLIGKYLFTRINGVITAGMITETEAYNGRTDRACHAHNNRFTKRTRIMYAEGGIAYVYLCYGIHNLFNIVTNVEGMADAILIRALEPKVGLDQMLTRRQLDKSGPRVSAGPGLVTQAMGITRVHYGADLVGDTLWLEDQGPEISLDQIASGPRIGVDYAGEDALLPWRFWLRDSKWVSKMK